MITKESLKLQVFKILENQLKDNNPIETKLTYYRLRAQALYDKTTREYISLCIIKELIDSLSLDGVFNTERYIVHLNLLPQEPFDE